MMLPTMPTDLRKEIASRLQETGITNSFDEAKWLICAAIDADTNLFISHGNIPLTTQQLQQVDSIFQRRLNHEPLSRILGEREFWSLLFQLNEDTLDPRPDSEIVVETALNYIPKEIPNTLLDLGAGTGCLLLSLLHERPQCYGIGVDLSPKAAQQARINAQNNDLDQRSGFITGSWGEAFKENGFDMIISNPPYIPSMISESLDTAVKNYDPDLALYGGNDGLQCYRDIADQVPHLLKGEGVCVLEIGYDQAAVVTDIFTKKGLLFLEKTLDLECRDRCLVFKG